MLRQALTLGMVFIFALSLLAASMITCFTYEAEADDPHCGWVWFCIPNGPCGWIPMCIPQPDWHTHG